MHDPCKDEQEPFPPALSRARRVPPMASRRQRRRWRLPPCSSCTRRYDTDPWHARMSRSGRRALSQRASVFDTRANSVGTPRSERHAKQNSTPSPRNTPRPKRTESTSPMQKHNYPRKATTTRRPPSHPAMPSSGTADSPGDTDSARPRRRHPGNSATIPSAGSEQREGGEKRMPSRLPDTCTDPSCTPPAHRAC